MYAIRSYYDNYNTGLFTFGNGTANNLAYTIGLSRNNLAIDPIYPQTGSSFSVSAKLSAPYSLFNKTDYKALKEERESVITSYSIHYTKLYDRDEWDKIGERYRPL